MSHSEIAALHLCAEDVALAAAPKQQQKRKPHHEPKRLRRFARWAILPMSTVGWIVMVACFSLYLSPANIISTSGDEEIVGGERIDAVAQDGGSGGGDGVDLTCLWDVAHPHWPILMWPTMAFATAWLLWHRYEDVGWRRNADLGMTITAIGLQTYNLVDKCPCQSHQFAYAAAAFSGLFLYGIGWFATTQERFRTGIVIHALTHIASYICNIVLFSCLSAGDPA